MGIRDRIKTRTTVKLTLTADDWQLYSGPLVALATPTLNAAVEEAINNASDRSEAVKDGLAALRRFRHLGALDSEPMRVLDMIVDRAFPRRTADLRL